MLDDDILTGSVTFRYLHCWQSLGLQGLDQSLTGTLIRILRWTVSMAMQQPESKIDTGGTEYKLAILHKSLLPDALHKSMPLQLQL